MARPTDRRTRRRWPRVLMAASVVGLTWLLTGPVVWAAGAPPVDAGDVVLLDAGDRDGLSGGDGNTAFIVQLPDGSTCPGDSFHDQWRIQSFMVPTTADVGSLSYGVIGPEGTDQHALFGADFAARSFANVLTPANAVAGQPGRIETPPAFSFAVAAEEMIAPGDYRIGIACTYFGATALFWDVEVVITAASGGDPDELRWRMASAPDQAGESPATDDRSWVAPTIVVVGLGAAAVPVATVLVRGRSRRLTPLPKESS